MVVVKTEAVNSITSVDIVQIALIYLQHESINRGGIIKKVSLSSKTL